MASTSESLKRVKLKVKKCQNPLFESWLKEWKNEAAKNGSDMQYCFNKALKSLRKFPIKLQTGKECLMLENFGMKICEMIDNKLEEYKSSKTEGTNDEGNFNSRNDINDFKIISTDVEIFESSEKKRKTSEISPPDINQVSETKTKYKRSTSEYIPAYRSGAYAILIAMFESSKDNNFTDFMTKAEIQRAGQDFCDSPLSNPLPGTYYSAWSSMSTLIKKGLVKKEGNPAKFKLTENGISLANNLKLLRSPSCVSSCPEVRTINSEYQDKISPIKKISKLPQTIGAAVEIRKTQDPGTNPVLRNLNHKSAIQEGISKMLTSPMSLSSPKKNENGGIQNQAKQQEKSVDLEIEDETFFLFPNNFEIILLVDTQERDNKFQQSENMTVRQLKSRGVNFEIRHLKVGDFIWIARDNYGHELVLPYIVERKRMDDLAKSIKDGRFHEQKFRLNRCGLENLIYLVEKYGNGHERLGLPFPTLMQAISNTQVVNGYTVKISNNHDHSMRYLNCLTAQLDRIFKGKTLMSCQKSNLSSINLSDDIISLMTFKSFNKGSQKNKKPNISNMLIKHLLQLNGVSVEKAKAIVQIYPTPKSLMEGLSREDGEKTIAKLSHGGFQRSIGPIIAKQLHMFYTSLSLS